ncbi:MAG: hypothetical protein L3J02_03285 [Henriciella sp.]|nr:hypothetical protein [Henriciella sp.]
MKPSDEILMAYADGELPEADRRQVEQWIADNPAFEQVVADHRAMRQAARAAFEPGAEPDLSAGLAGLVGELQASVAAPVLAPAPKRKRRRLAWPAAVAASFLMGAMGTQFAGVQMASTGTYLDWDDQGLVAHRQLARVLDQQAGDVQAGAIVINASFVASDGRYCRQFVIEGETHTGAIACHQNQRWEMITVAVLPTGYQAAGGGNDALAATAVRLGVKEKLSPEQEAELIRRGWEASAKD